MRGIIMERIPKITVMGSFVVDLMAYAPQLPVPGQTVKGGPFRMGAGGKGANQAVAARRCGADVTLITKLGQDAFAQLALDNFRAEGIDARYVLRDAEKGTGAALILVDRATAQNMILVAPQACENISVEEICHALPAIESADLAVTQLETNLEAVMEFVQIARGKNIPVILNPAPFQPVPDELFSMVDYLTPNESEAGQLTGLPVKNPDDAVPVADLLLGKGVKHVIVTLGDKGAYLRTQELSLFLEPRTVNVVDTTGAGDAFNGGLAYALGCGWDFVAAANFAMDVAALSVTKEGTAQAMPTREEIEIFRGKH